MIRARFKVPGNDGRPMIWPIKHPFWITGYGDDYVTVVAYADDKEELLLNWPDCVSVDEESCTNYVFTDRFQKPDWFVEQQK